MGHSSKKKKKKGKGARGRGRNSSKDHSSQSDEDQELINDELTALASMFQEDFKIISESPKVQFEIILRPYYNDLGYGNANVSASLNVRFLPGYPHKCPKLHIEPEEGLSEKDRDQLLSLLNDQANMYAREGREMIYNLVETAQEFLSEITPLKTSNKSTPTIDFSKPEKTKFFVCSSIDLFSDLSGDTSWEMNNTEIVNQKLQNPNNKPSIISQTGDTKQRKNIPLKSQTEKEYSVKIPNLPKRGSIHDISSKLDSVAEESENEKYLNDSSEENYDSENSEDDNIEGSSNLGEQTFDSQPSTSSSFGLVPDDDDNLQSKKKDLLLVHFLRMSCASKQSPSLNLPELSSELCKLGVLSDWAKDLIEAPVSQFTETFNQVFEKQETYSQFSQIFKTDNNFGEDNSATKSNSRYLNDFEELRSLGHGGFGHVALCQNKLDGRRYAVKKIPLKDKNPLVNDKILREVATLSLLQHQHVVRYYQSWFETSYGGHYEESDWGSMTNESASSANPPNTEKQEITYLYIQMEFCPRTLRQELESESYTSFFKKDYAWHFFRQIVEGLAHIHSQGIIHRDLNPNNIFFDVRNDIKIGDFGLAKFLKLEQLEQEQYFPTNSTGVSMDGTGQVGTYFYTAPEIEQKWPQINEKVDMYSLGVIFFELWHPFATAMERHIVLSDLKLKLTPPNSWIQKFPNQFNLLNRLMAQSPSDRPSAIEVLQHELPPRMEDEWLNDVLRMIQAPEDTYVYDRVVSTIFNEERLINKFSNNNEGRRKIMRNESLMQASDVDYEFRDVVADVSKEVFKRHCARKMDYSPLSFLDGTFPFNRKTVKLMTQGGNILELCHEFRSPFVLSIASNQITSFKRYEIEWVYRKAIGRSTPSRFLQGDFDIVGGEPVITEAEVLKVAVDITSRFFNSNAIDIRINHGLLLDSIWSWVGISNELRKNVAELLSLIGPSSPQSTNRKSNWKFIRRQLLQDLHLSEGVVDRLQAADVRFCGSPDKVIARLRGALSSDKSTCKALEDISDLLTYLKTWCDKVVLEKCITIDVLVPPSEIYYTGIFFQIYARESNPEATLIAIGGRYDYLVEEIWDHDFKINAPGAVGVSIALEKFLRHPSLDIRPLRSEPVSILVCSKGGGGLLEERMEFVSELWNANIRADIVPLLDPSLKDQYEYASEHDFKCLVIITESDLVKVRYLELKKEKELPREEIVKFLSDAISSQFRNLTIWG